MIETVRPPSRHTLIARLQALLADYRVVEADFVTATISLASAKSALAQAELNAWHNGLVLGSNAEQRMASLRLVTEDERKPVEEAERTRTLAASRRDVVLTEIGVLKACARLLAGEEN